MSHVNQITLANLDLFESGNVWDIFDELRSTSPVHWDEEEAPNSGFWSLTSYNDIVKVLRDTEVFSSEKGAVNLEELDYEQLEARKSMLETDGIRHRALRKLMQERE